ncbi:Ig domain-containing protein [Spirosoma soli]|uniref:Ig domain-containing protein n=1 Tax=Spirosoma soli TaxID=1770529 RepID=A0ABW5M570_9BACT
MEKSYLQAMKGIWRALLGIGLVHGQVTWAQLIPDVQWTRPGSTLAVTTDGNIVTTDFVSIAPPSPTSPGQGGDRFTKYSPQGDIIWQKGPFKGGFYLGGRINGYDYETIAKVLLTAPTTDGGLAIMGKTSLRSANVITKIFADGSVRRWEDSDLIGYSGEGIFEDMVGTPDGGFLLVFTNPQYQVPTTKVVVIKYDAGGSRSWTKEVAYPTSGTTEPSLTKAEAVINAPDGGYLIVGYYNTTGNLISEANPSLIGNTGWAAKLDTDGNVVWQKLLTDVPVNTNSNGPLPNSVSQILPVTDVTLAADGIGYALVGFGLPLSSASVSEPTTAILELGLTGSIRRARLLNTPPTESFITIINRDGGLFYAVGNTNRQNGADPHVVTVLAAQVAPNNPVALSVNDRRTFDGPTDGSLQGISKAGDGGIVFVSSNNQITKLKKSDPSYSTGLTLTPPTYNCQTGSITFNTVGGDNTTITYSAPGITRSALTDNFGVVEQGLRNDPKVITITATQSGATSSYNFDLKAACSSAPSPGPPVLNGPVPDQSVAVGQSINFPIGSYFSDPTTNVPGYSSNWSFWASGLPNGLSLSGQQAPNVPNIFIVGNSSASGVYTVTVTARTAAFPNNPVSATFRITVSPTNLPTGDALTLLAPSYDCASGAFTFRTSGGDGSLIEFQAIGITAWTSNPNQFVDKESRTVDDVQPFTLMARQSGKMVTYTWNLKAACGRARVATKESGSGLQVRVLGNPVVGQAAELEIMGVTGQKVQLTLIDGQGRSIYQHIISQSGAMERVTMPLGRSSGLLVVQINTAQERKAVKLLRP